MLLTLPQAAEKLGKSPRQIRYLLKTGKLKAEKHGGRWLLAIEELPKSDGQQRAENRRKDALREAVENVLDLKPSTEGTKKRYSLRDLRAFQVAKPIYFRSLDALGPEHEGVRALRSVIEQLSCGCHRFTQEEKGDAYREARDSASQAVSAFVLTSEEEHPAHALADAIEQDLMPAFAGLLRRFDRKRKW